MTTLNSSDATSLLASIICHALTEGLTQACNLPWHCGDIVSSTARGSLAQAQEIYCLSFETPLEGRCFVAVLPREAASPESGADLHAKTGTVNEAVQTMLQRLKAMLRGGVGDINVTVEPAQATDLPMDEIVMLSAELSSEDTQLSVQLLFEAPLASSLRKPHIVKLLTLAVPTLAAHANLDLVMDVALSVSLRFGRCQLPLREVIELTSGSVVELDRQVDEPVELVLDGRVVARGEAVIIDGNYGMRVTQIVQPLLNM